MARISRALVAYAKLEMECEADLHLGVPQAVPVPGAASPTYLGRDTFSSALAGAVQGVGSDCDRDRMLLEVVQVAEGAVHAQRCLLAEVRAARDRKLAPATLGQSGSAGRAPPVGVPVPVRMPVPACAA